MKLVLSVLTVVSLVCGSAFAAPPKKEDPKPAPAAKSAPAPRAEPPAARPAPAPRAEPAAPRQQPAAPRQAPAPKPAPAPRAEPAAPKAQPAAPKAQPSQQAPKKEQPAPKTESPKTEPSKPVSKPTQSGNQQQQKPQTPSTPVGKPTQNGNQTKPSTPVGKPTQKPPLTQQPKPVTLPPKPTTHAPPAPKPVTAKPTQVQQQKKQETAVVKAKAPPAVAAKIAAAGPGATAKVNKNNTITIRDAKGNTKVVDATTGKQRMSYNANTGKSVYTPPSGAVTVTKGNQTVRTAPGGFKQTETRKADGTKTVETQVRGTTVVKNYTSKNTYVTNKTVIINNKTVVINENRNYVVVNRGYGFVPVYTPVWYGRPSLWTVGGVVVFDAFYPRAGYISPYWGNGGFVMFGNPYTCAFGGCWADYSWYGNRYYDYSGYYVAATTFVSIGDFMVDAYLQAQLENDNMLRQAAIDADANYLAEQAALAAQNSPAVNQGNQPIPSDLRETLVQQFQDAVAATQSGTPLQASDMISANDGEGNGHIFGVNDPMTEDTTVNDNPYQCQLGHGDFLVQDPNASLDTEPVYQTDDNGNTLTDGNGDPMIETDDSGNAVTNTYVTMLVKKSKRGDCAEGLDVVVQVDTLQNMVDEESAQAQKSMERAVSQNIGQ